MHYFSSLFPKDIEGNKVLLPLSLLLTGFYINSFVGIPTVTKVESNGSSIILGKSQRKSKPQSEK
jgi:hypothetical protein